MIGRSVRKFKETVEIRSLAFNRLRSHRYFPLAAITVVLLLASSIHVWQRVMVIGLVQEVSRLQRENRSLVDDTQKVQSEIATLSMTARIEQYAVDSLGMTRVTADRLITLVPEATRAIPADELATMLTSIGRIVDYLPVVTEAQAGERELQPIKFDVEGRGTE